MKLYNILSAICLMLMFASCEKELDFEYHDIDPLTVIEAELTQPVQKLVSHLQLLWMSR